MLLLVAYHIQKKQPALLTNIKNKSPNYWRFVGDFTRSGHKKEWSRFQTEQLSHLGTIPVLPVAGDSEGLKMLSILILKLIFQYRNIGYNRVRLLVFL